MAVPSAIAYEITDGGKLGRLTAQVAYGTTVTGHNCALRQLVNGLWVSAALHQNGVLRIEASTTWDFGSGPAIDTPAVVIASLCHDIFCHMTNLRLIPWECRAKADKFYRDSLKANGVGMVRRYAHWLAVSTYSQAVARWRDKA